MVAELTDDRERLDRSFGRPEAQAASGVRQAPGGANRGYGNLKPLASAALPALEAGAAHQLQAQIHGDELRVHVDGRVVWQGTVRPVAGAFSGPVGMHTDNTRLEFTFATQPPTAAREPVAPCRTGAQASD